ncbi:helix-turn-helix domain-containing protein [Stenotrophomonas indicatrix]|uniref:helix-turn-helix domain-containing protein n=1 Tax=Stenotrophomonas indicatrix TaxID=2045451 RepID=UPI000C1941C5|nr:XRE family transcriptional regulator [Stenotrophomonas indicatrix]PII12233.1 hypothetical protein CR918_11165 [Stenotrophomonas indicatrix]
MTQLVYDNIFDVAVDDEAESADLKFRAELILALRAYCDGRGWTRKDIAGLLAVPQSRVSEMMTGKLHLVSTDRLISYASKLGFALHASYKKPSGSKSGTIKIDVELDELEIA